MAQCEYQKNQQRPSTGLADAVFRSACRSEIRNPLEAIVFQVGRFLRIDLPERRSNRMIKFPRRHVELAAGGLIDLCARSPKRSHCVPVIGAGDLLEIL